MSSVLRISLLSQHYFLLTTISAFILLKFCFVDVEGNSSAGLKSSETSINSTQQRFLTDQQIRESEESDDNTRPVFKATTRNITVAPGDRAVLKCRVENLGTKIVTWRRKDEVHPLTIGLNQFTSDNRITVDYNQRTIEWNLIIQNVHPTDEGVYQCQISTKNEQESYEVILNVKNIQVYGTEFLEAGGTMRLKCNATGKPNPPHSVDWFKGPEKVISDSQGGVIITKKIETRVLASLLEIRNSQLSDSGQYICRSSNGDSGSINVRVIQATAPTNLQQGSSGRSDTHNFNSLSFGSSFSNNSLALQFHKTFSVFNLVITCLLAELLRNLQKFY